MEYNNDESALKDYQKEIIELRDALSQDGFERTLEEVVVAEKKATAVMYSFMEMLTAVDAEPDIKDESTDALLYKIYFSTILKELNIQKEEEDNG